MVCLTRFAFYEVLLSVISGWLPSYWYVCLGNRRSRLAFTRVIFTSVSAVLLQIKLAISSTTPYPARLQTDWDR
jgi:hypothetical protein